MDLPQTFKPSRFAPPLQDLNWLHTWLTTHKNEYPHGQVLEFGCGITSWVLFDALRPAIQVAVDSFEPCAKMVQQHLPDIKVIKTNWHDIPKLPYDVLFVDASTAPPKDLVWLYPECACRADTIKYSEAFISPHCLVIMHDWNHHCEWWRRSRAYVEQHSYTLLDSFASKRGIGVYRRNLKSPSTP